MKKYKNFRAEQQHLAEIGPIGAVMMGAMGLFGLGFAGYKAYKKTKEGITGYIESRSQKKDNKKNGMDITLKIYNPASGKEEAQDFYINPKGRNPELEEMGIDIDRRTLNTDDEGIAKIEKKLQLAATKWTKETRREDRAGVLSPKKQELIKRIHPSADEPTVKKDDEPSANTAVANTATANTAVANTATATSTDAPTDTPDTEVERDEDGNIKNQKDAQAAFEKGGMKQAPDGWTKDPEDQKKVIKPEDIKKTPKKQEKKPDNKGFVKTSTGSKKVYNSNVLSFGEFIAEDVMSDMKKASKSSKDSEIKLGDGTVIPIDKLTAQIFVKYIEGLEKSEQKKTINQIQRTERAFMKVLGQAHEG